MDEKLDTEMLKVLDVLLNMDVLEQEKEWDILEELTDVDTPEVPEEES